MPCPNRDYWYQHSVPGSKTQEQSHHDIAPSIMVFRVLPLHAHSVIFFWLQAGVKSKAPTRTLLCARVLGGLSLPSKVGRLLLLSVSITRERCLITPRRSLSKWK